MRKCKCGCEEFIAHQVVHMDILVDPNNNNWIGSPTGDCAEDIYDSDEPFGPYTCAKCGMVYEEIDDIPDVEEEHETDTPEPVLVIKTILSARPYDGVAFDCDAKKFESRTKAEEKIFAFIHDKIGKDNWEEFHQEIEDMDTQIDTRDFSLEMGRDYSYLKDKIDMCEYHWTVQLLKDL